MSERPSSEPDPIDSAQDETPAPKRRASSKNQGRRASRDILPSKDISSLLKGWDYEPGTINVRKIAGVDGQPKLQMRVDLGLLQMELSGRPDGARPHGCESLLQFHENRLADHHRMHGTDMGFALNSDECQSLREEAVMYYHRYLSLFVLEEFTAVVRDTARNLRVLDLCGRFADEEEDRLVLEQYRPYIVMMNTRASASILMNRQAYVEALQIVDDGLANIREFFERFDQEEAFSQSNEVRSLKKLARDIRKKMPIDPLSRLKAQLEKAVKIENYEQAARLRDELRRLQS